MRIHIDICDRKAVDIFCNVMPVIVVEMRHSITKLLLWANIHSRVQEAAGCCYLKPFFRDCHTSNRVLQTKKMQYDFLQKFLLVSCPFGYWKYINYKSCSKLLKLSNVYEEILWYLFSSWYGPFVGFFSSGVWIWMRKLEMKKVILLKTNKICNLSA